MMQSIVSYPSLLRTVGLSGAGFSPRLVTDPTSFSDAENSLQIGSFDRSEIKKMILRPVGFKRAYARDTQPEKWV